MLDNAQSMIQKVAWHIGLSDEDIRYLLKPMPNMFLLLK